MYLCSLSFGFGSPNPEPNCFCITQLQLSQPISTFPQNRKTPKSVFSHLVALSTPLVFAVRILASAPEVPLRNFTLATLVMDHLSLAGKTVIIGTVIASSASRNSKPSTTAVSVEWAVNAACGET